MSARNPDSRHDTTGSPRLSRRRFLGSAALGAGSLAFPSILLACGGGSGGGGGGSAGGSGGGSMTGQITAWVGKDNAHPQQQQQLLSQITAEFAKQHPGATVSFETWASAGEELTKLETAAASHQGPDIFEFGSTLVPTAFATGAFETVTDSMWRELGGRDSFFAPQLTMSGPTPGKDIAVPVTGNPYALVYNTKIFDAAGIKKPPATWNEFVDIAKQVTNPGKNQWGTTMATGDQTDPWHKIWLFVTQLGGQLLSSDGKKGLLDSDQVVEATSFWLDWMARYKIASTQNATYTVPEALKAFAAGNSAMMVMEGPGDMVTLDASPIAGQYAWVPGPTVPYGMSKMPKNGKPAQGFVSGQYWTIFKYSPHRQLALDLIKIYVSPAIQYQTWKLRGQQPVVLKTFDQYPETKKGSWATFYDAESKAYPTEFSGSFGQLEVVLVQALNKLAAGIATSGTYSKDQVKQALTAANQQLTASLGSH